MFKFLFLMLIYVFLPNVFATHSTKICNSLRSTLEAKGTANVVINFKQETLPILDTASRMSFKTRGDKITYLKRQLELHAATTQENVTTVLRNGSSSSPHATFESFWINNQIIMKNASMDLIQSIADSPEIAEIREERIIQVAAYNQGRKPEGDWGLKKIEADQVWNYTAGHNGDGIVVATIDTGARATHEALRSNHRNGYGWFDPYFETPNPTDNNGHGTHTMGIIVGSGGIGIVPGAQWIACRGCQNMECTEIALSRCAQWITCPTLPNGNSPDCSKAPHVVSNSWSVGMKGDNRFTAIINSWHTAGIVPVFAIGNSGPSCGSVEYPGDYEDVIGVGAPTETDNITHFSSRGPNGNGKIKPDLVAPGISVRSAWYTSDMAYNTISGTSVAAPHVAGTIAILLSKNPDLSFDQIKNLLQDNTDRDLGEAGTCSGTHSLEWPNNIYGYGRVNTRKALAAVV